MLHSEFTIRRADLDDAAAIARVHVASWHTTYPGIVDQEDIEQLTVELRTAMWTKRLRGEAAPVAHVFVAIGGSGEVVGFASGGPLREPWPPFDGELYAIYLLAEVQGQGVGRALIRAWAADQLERGLSSAVVGVLAANPARCFYERLGARWLREGTCSLVGHDYPDVWYGWDSVVKLTQ